MKLLTPGELEAELRDIGAKRYHRQHPFHGLLHGGKCTKGQVQAWALNRYYYQAMIPLKDESLIARCEDSAIRRECIASICGSLAASDCFRARRFPTRGTWISRAGQRRFRSTRRFSQRRSRSAAHGIA